MQLSDLIAQTRVQMDDVARAPQLWSDADITLYLNEALRDACIRAKLIHDKYTDVNPFNLGAPLTLLNITTCAVTPATPTGFNFEYFLDPSIFLVDTAVYVDTQLPILEVPEDMYLRDRWHYRYGYGYATPGIFGDYNTASAARATAWWCDVGPKGSLVMRLLPFPNASTYVDQNGATQPIQIRLNVYRTQIEDLDVNDLTMEPEIDPRFHLQLIDGASSRMYMRRDRDTYDPAKADIHEAAFTRNFGQKVDANILRQRREYRRNRTRPRFPS